MAGPLQVLTFLALLCCCCWVGAGCAGKGERTPEKAAAAPNTGAGEENPVTPLVIVGEVAYVDRDAGFVLLRSSPSVRITPGEELESRAWEGGLTGNLILGSERKRQFLVADIVDGAPSVGDQIYHEAEVVFREPAKAQGHAIGTRGTRPNTRKSGLKRG